LVKEMLLMECISKKYEMITITLMMDIREITEGSMHLQCLLLFVLIFASIQ